MRKIAIFTGSRADASPLDSVMKALGGYLPITTEGLYGHESDIKEKLEQAKPDIIVILGDRYESLVCASVASLLCIPICHIHGGEETEGAVDNAFRHAITKLSYWHFCAHEDYAKRIIQMGEAPERVFVTGAPGVDQYAKGGHVYYGRMGLALDYALVCYHPETLGSDEDNLHLILQEARKSEAFVVSTCNQDIGERAVNDFWKANGIIPDVMDDKNEWVSHMRNADILIGNSSCFIIEGMTLGKKVINIGDRQKGRYEAALKHFADNPYAYGKPGEVGPRIAELLMTLPIPEKPRKAFYDSYN